MKKKLFIIIASILVICFAAGAYAVNLPKYFSGNGKLFDSTCTAEDKNEESKTDIDCENVTQKERTKDCMPPEAAQDYTNNLSKAETNNSTDCAEKRTLFPFRFILNPEPKTFQEKISAFAAKFLSVFGNRTNPSCTAPVPDDGTTKPFEAPPPVTAEETKPAPSEPAVTTPATSNIPDAEPSDNLSFEQKVAELVNAQRAKYGLAPFTLSTQLSNVARIKSQDMSENNYFSHTSPVFGSTFSLLKSHGISYRTAGENIAMGYRTPESVMDGWMNSPGHRANILSAKYTKIGVGYVAQGNYWTQVFIG